MPQPDPPTIAFLAAGFIQWTGGVDFLRLCIGGMNAVLPDKVWPVLLPDETYGARALAFAVASKRRVFSFAGVRPPVTPHVSDVQLCDAVTSIGCNIRTSSYYGSVPGLADAMQTGGFEVVLPAMTSLGPGFSRPWVGYIPDLQHKHIPENFSTRERWERDRKFAALLADAPAIIVNSRSVARDIAEFYPHAAAPLFSLPFCPSPTAALLSNIDEETLRTYALPERFFIISNQFWVHKSHQTAFDALNLVRDAGFRDVHIICTGNVHDYRDPGYVDRLRAKIVRDGIEDRIHLVGVIPKTHQLAIMSRSVAVVQPTLFEGGPGGGALYDGVSTGTPVILSDIEVNREADLGVLKFFRAGSAEDLAAKMIEVLESPPRRLSVEATVFMLRKRQQELGETLLRAACSVVDREKQIGNKSTKSTKNSISPATKR